MHRTKTVLLFFVLLLAAFFRFWHITETPPGLYPDEAMNGNNAVEALQTGHFKIFYPENNGREGLFINIQALSVWLFGNEPWALRIVSALFGTFTVLGIYLLARELFHKNNFQVSSFKFQVWKLKIENSELIALLSAFFLATSFWHINFSRIGFRAIMVPFFLVWSFYFLYRLLRALREENAASKKPESFAVLGGILFGLGFHTYIAYRAAPLLLVPPLLLAWQDYKNSMTKKCTPCLLALFLFTAFIAALPIGYYFLTHPEDFAGRTAQVSIFASEKPVMTLGLNVIKTIGMFFWAGDYNGRHNLAGAPQLWWPIGILFFLGITISLTKNPNSQTLNTKQIPNSNAQNQKRFGSLSFGILNLFRISDLGFRISSTHFFLLFWLLVMSLPAIVTVEGIPHALRTIGMIPPAMILAAMGTVWIFEKKYSWLLQQKIAWPHKSAQLKRISWELGILAIVLLMALPLVTAKQYFFEWARGEETQNAFSEPYAFIGRELASLPPELPKYVIVNADGVLVRGIPMPAQTIMFVAEGGIASRGVPTPRNITYLLPEDENILDTLTEPYAAVWLNPK